MKALANHREVNRISRRTLTWQGLGEELRNFLAFPSLRRKAGKSYEIPKASRLDIREEISPKIKS